MALLEVLGADGKPPPDGLGQQACALQTFLQGGQDELRTELDRRRCELLFSTGEVVVGRAPGCPGFLDDATPTGGGVAVPLEEPHGRLDHPLSRAGGDGRRPGLDTLLWHTETLTGYDTRPKRLLTEPGSRPYRLQWLGRAS